MFTGIVESVGQLESMQDAGGDVRLRVSVGSMDMSDVSIGDSICTSGCCLTVVELFADGFSADVSTETLRVTTLGDWQVGTLVNLERSLMPTSRMGGHMVSGHVDGIAEVISRESSARAEVFLLKAPANLAKYIAKKGSVTIDGVSLTVNDVDGAAFSLTIVPHTLAETIIGDYKTGTLVNIEVDLIARYLERLQQGDAASQGTDATH